jgi:hypothetical protein
MRCLLEHPTRRSEDDVPLYEERVLIWFAENWTQAFWMAEKEAREYAREAQSTFIKVTDGFRLFDENIGNGTEVWSTMRESSFSPETYADTFCATHRDRSTTHSPGE